MKEIRLVEIDSELGAGTRGASLGIGALKVAAYNMDLPVFRDYDSDKVETLNHCLWEEIDTPNAKYIYPIVDIYERTCAVLNEVYEEDCFPVILSGDHSTAGGTISGIKKAHPDKRLGVVWIDAHADMHTPFTTPSGNVHGMPLATALKADNLENRRNDPAFQTVEAWQRLKDCGCEGEKLKPEDLIFVAVRDTEREEDDLIRKLGIRNVSVDDLREKGAGIVGKNILDQLAGCDIIYVSFDVDSMDCDLVSHGTGTPVENGLTPSEAEELIAQLVVSDKVVCFEIVEVNPCLDEKVNKMAETAVVILNNTVQIIDNRLKNGAGNN